MNKSKHEKRDELLTCLLLYHICCKWIYIFFFGVFLFTLCSRITMWNSTCTSGGCNWSFLYVSFVNMIHCWYNWLLEIALGSLNNLCWCKFLAIPKIYIKKPTRFLFCSWRLFPSHPGRMYNSPHEHT